MLEKILIFVLFLGPLVFFHELGHYLFARLAGVRVEVFSIGFGPKILKFKKGFTEYAISLIPLGGYVKMFGDDPFSEDKISEEQRKYSFVHKGKWARFWIVFGGPLANFILAYAIYFSLFLTGEKVPEIKLGLIEEQSTFYNYGFRTGDVLKKVNGQIVASPSDIALSTDKTLDTFSVERNGIETVINIPSNFNIKPEKFFEEVSQYPPVLVWPIVKSNNGDHFFLSTDKNKINVNISFEELAQIKSSEIYLRKMISLDVKDGKPQVDFAAEAKTLLITNDNIFSTLRESKYFPIDTVVGGITMNSPAAQAGLRQGDIISKIDGEKIYNFNGLKSKIQNLKSKDVKITVIKEGKESELLLTPEVKNISGKEVRLIGVYTNSQLYLRPKFVDIAPLGLIEALPKSFDRTIGAITKTFEGFKKLITAEVSFKNIGGPISIGKVASDSFNISFSYFLQLMALISVNLGVINLFPIPVLDGGHIVFIILETLNGGPLSRRKLEIAQQFGLTLLLLLMVGALFNDFSRFF